MNETLLLKSPVISHEHGWITESRHSTSEGMVIYVKCTHCDARRVDLIAHGMPAALSRATN